MQESPVGERELNEVDRVIGATVKACRGESTKPAAANNDDDVKSHISKAASTVSRSKSVASSSMMIYPDN